MALFVIILGVSSFCAGVLAFVRFGLDGPLAARLIISHLERMSGRTISYSSAHLGWFSLADGVMDFANLEVRDRPNERPWLSVRRIVLEVNLAAVLRGTLLINRAVLSEPALALSCRSREESPSLLTFPFESSRLLLYPIVRSLEISDGTLAFKKPDGSSWAGETLFSHTRIAIENVTLKGAERFSAKGTAIGSQQKGSFEVSGRLKASRTSRPHWTGKINAALVRCPLAPFLHVSSCLGYEAPLNGGTADMNVEISGGPRNCKARGEVTISRTVVVKGDLFGRSVNVDRLRVRFAAERVDDNLHVDLSDAVLPGLAISMEARAGKIFTPDASLTLAVRSAALDLAKIFPLIPLSLLNNEDRKRLAEAGLKGRILIGGGAWSGKVSDFSAGAALQGTLALEADLEQVSGFIPRLGLPVSDATGRIHLVSDEIQFKGVGLTLGSSPIVLNGWIRDLKKSPRTDLFVSTTARAQDLKPILENRVFAPYVGGRLGLLVEPQGGIAITLDLKGKLSHPVMKGKITLDGFQCGLSGFPLPLRKVSGSVRFRGASVTISQLKGMIGESTATLQGEVASTKLDLAGDLKLSHADIKKLRVLPKGWSFSGSVPIAFKLRGKPTDVGFSVTADFKPAGFTDGAYIAKKPGVPLKLEASGSRNPDGINVEEAYAVVESSRIAAKASFKSDGKVFVSINLPPKGIPTQVLAPFAHPTLELQQGGRVEGDAIVRKEPSGRPAVEMNLALSHVSLNIPGFYKRTEGMVGKIRLGAKTLQVDVERAKQGSSHFFGTCSISDFDRPKVDLVLEYSFLDTTDYTAPPGHVSSLTWGDWIRNNRVVRFLARAKATGFIKASKGRTGVRTFSDFKASIEGTRGLLRVPSWQLRVADGILRGTGLFDIRKETTRFFVMDFQGDQLKMEQLLMSDQDWMRISGNVLLEGKMEWKLGTSPENNGLDKIGSLELRMQEGIVNRFDILSKLFSLVNLGSILSGRLPDITANGLPFRRLTCRMTVFDTKWLIKDLTVLSDAARIDASGMYFGGQERIDFKVNLSPLVGFDRIFGGIFGNTLTKNGKLLTTTFRVRGLYKSPDVRLEPFEGFRSRE